MAQTVLLVVRAAVPALGTATRLVGLAQQAKEMTAVARFQVRLQAAPPLVAAALAP
jgi:hypothetical protein